MSTHSPLPAPPLSLSLPHTQPLFLLLQPRSQLANRHKLSPPPSCPINCLKARSITSCKPVTVTPGTPGINQSQRWILRLAPDLREINSVRCSIFISPPDFGPLVNLKADFVKLDILNVETLSSRLLLTKRHIVEHVTLTTFVSLVIADSSRRSGSGHLVCDRNLVPRAPVPL